MSMLSCYKALCNQHSEYKFWNFKVKLIELVSDLVERVDFSNDLGMWNFRDLKIAEKFYISVLINTRNLENVAT